MKDEGVDEKNILRAVQSCYRGTLQPESAFSMPSVSTASMVSMPSCMAISTSSLSFFVNPWRTCEMTSPLPAGLPIPA